MLDITGSKHILDIGSGKVSKIELQFVLFQISFFLIQITIMYLVQILLSVKNLININ